VTIRREDEPIKYGNVTYPAIITSKARVKWWLAAKEIEKNGGRLLYCDTDSIFAAFKDNQDNKKYGDVF
jgi:DNA polymerase elongation subunit (family B)